MSTYIITSFRFNLTMEVVLIMNDVELVCALDILILLIDCKCRDGRASPTLFLRNNFNKLRLLCTVYS